MGGSTSLGASSAKALALLPDGQIVVATENGLVRYSANGAFETFIWFGVPLNIQVDDLYGISSLAVQSDGKIVAAGSVVTGFQ
jgi:hypothetical protein